MISFIAGIILGAFLLKAYQFTEFGECPRIIRGYNCKGDGCDHSPGAVAEAKWDMRK